MHGQVFVMSTIEAPVYIVNAPLSVNMYTKPRIYNKLTKCYEPLQKLRVRLGSCKKVQVGKDQEKAQSEKDSHSKNRGGKKPN